MNLFNLAKFARGRGRSGPLMGEDGERQKDPYLPTDELDLMNIGSEGLPGEKPNSQNMGGSNERDDRSKVNGHGYENNPKVINDSVPESHHSLLNDEQKKRDGQSDFGEGVADKNTFDSEEGGIADNNLGLLPRDSVGNQVPKLRGPNGLPVKRREPPKWSAFDHAKKLKGI